MCYLKPELNKISSGLFYALRSSIFWFYTALICSYRRFGRTYRFTFKNRGTASTSKMGPISCPETSVTNHQSTPRDIAGEQRPYLDSDGSLKSRTIVCVVRIKFMCTSVGYLRNSSTPRLRRKYITKINLQEKGLRTLAEFTSLRTGTSCGRL